MQNGLAYDGPMRLHLGKRRQALYQQLGAGRTAIVSNPKAAVRNGSVTHPYRPGSDLWYLTEFPEPEAIAVFTPGGSVQYTLFTPPRDAQRETYTGARSGPEEAVQQYGADQAFPLTEFSQRLPGLLQNSQEICLTLGEHPDLEASVLSTIAHLRKSERSRFATAPKTLRDLRWVLHEQRLHKDEHALACMQEAIRITALAHREVRQKVHAGMTEKQVTALVEYIFAQHGGSPGYETIVASGSHATILHYTQGNGLLKENQLLLVDAGCEWHGFTADVTRTFPIPARAGQARHFSPAQRRLYRCVLRAQEAGIAMARPGKTLDDIHASCTYALVEGLIELGFLQGTPDALIRSQAHKPFCRHLTSHWLGLDVHDVGAYYPNNQPRILSDGIVFTIEPGLYVAEDAPVPKEYQGLGIRIEDDILITSHSPTGNQVLTQDIPKTLEDMEQQ